MTADPKPDLHSLAAAAGVMRHWRDVDGRDHMVRDAALVPVLEALGHKTGSTRAIRTALARLAEGGRALPPLLVGEVGQVTVLPVSTTATWAVLTDESGAAGRLAIDNGVLSPAAAPGYYDLEFAGHSTRLAVAPRCCPLPGDGQARLGGAVLQIPALRGARRSAFGGFGELAEAVGVLAEQGCQAAAINPVHALFPGAGEDYSPYSPSSRTFLNAAMADPALLGLPPLKESSGGELIDWSMAMPERLTALRTSFAGLSHAERSRIAAANRAEGEGLARHALHDALFCHFRSKGAKSWREWPAAYRSPDHAAARRFAEQHAEEVEFHAYAQWLAREGLAAVQQRARAEGMAVGLIADLAVGVHTAGSDSWAMPGAMLRGLTIGAPPDPLGPLGQNWSITGFSPQGLRDSGYAPWIAMLRAAFRSAGGLRIDHAFGLARLWVIPDGAQCSEGAYLTYPFLDLVRLATLEAHRASALVVAEDLGTAPPGFTREVTQRAMLGMRVLWFERAADHGFIGGHDYPAHCAAMTGTHDTQTVAGWWKGRDLDWADKLGRLPSEVDHAKAEEIRDWDRGLLWSTIGTGAARPAPDNPGPVVDAALRHVAQTPAILALAPLEDVLGDEEQPNLPGTTTEHPNWRRRLSAPLADLVRNPQVRDRLSAIGAR